MWAAFDSPQSSAVVWLFPPRVVVMLERDFRNFAILISPLSQGWVAEVELGVDGGCPSQGELVRASQHPKSRPRPVSGRSRLIAAFFEPKACVDARQGRSRSVCEASHDTRTHPKTSGTSREEGFFFFLPSLFWQSFDDSTRPSVPFDGLVHERS